MLEISFPWFSYVQGEEFKGFEAMFRAKGSRDSNLGT